MIQIGQNQENGQVMVYTRTAELGDIFVDKLLALPESVGIRKCHSYSDREVTVRFSFIHPSIDVEKDIIHGFLEKECGKVVDWWPVIHPRLKVPIGPVMFVMTDHDLQENPLPEAIYLQNDLVYITYRTQARKCHTCGEVGHFARQCPTKRNELYPELFDNQPSVTAQDVFLPGFQSFGTTAHSGRRTRSRYPEETSHQRKASVEKNNDETNSNSSTVVSDSEEKSDFESEER